MERTSFARRVYLWIAWLFLASVVFQVFLIGLNLFASADIGLHQSFGSVVLLLAIIVLILAFAARLPGRSKRWASGLLLLTFVQMLLPGFKDAGLGLIAALHPVNAFLVFWVGLVVLRDARDQATMGAAAVPAADIARTEAPVSSA